MNLCVDFGHNSNKGTDGTIITLNDNEMIDVTEIPSVLGEVKELFLDDELSQIEKNPLNYLKIKQENREYFYGDLARRQSDLCIQNVNDDDSLTAETKLMIQSTSALLAKEEKINLVTDLPITHFRDKKQVKKFAESLKGEFKVSFYDFFQEKYNEKQVNFENVDVKPQGFLALMSVLLTDRGSIKPEMKKIASGMNVVIDIGLYSIDVYICNAMEPIIKVPLKPIPGMIAAFRLIAEFLFDEFGIRKELNEIEKYARAKKIVIGNESCNLQPVINIAYNQLVSKAVSEINNLIPFWAEVNYWWLCGGGAIPLGDDFKTRYKNIKVMDRPTYANAIGGIFWSRRKWGNG